MSAPRSSVVVLSLRPGDWLAPCLASVADQADEVVVVDNGSDGAAASVIARQAGAVVVRSEKNLGFAGGVNLGVARAQGEIVALLNDDAIAGPGWLEAAGRVLEDASVAAVTPKVLLSGWYREVVLEDDPFDAPDDHRVLGRQIYSVTADGEEVLHKLAGIGAHALETGPDDRRWRWSHPGHPFYVPVPGPESGVLIDGSPPPGAVVVCRLVNKAGSYLRPDGVLGDVGSESPDDGRFDSGGERFFASGTALVARAAVWRSVGALASPLFAYYEDGDWSWRARLSGLRVVYDPSAVVSHRQSATSGGAADVRVRVLARRNKLLVMVRNAPRRVYTDLLRTDLQGGSQEGARRATLMRLPWALSTRRQLSRKWVLSPEEVWSAWAGVDNSWDRGPYRSG